MSTSKPALSTLEISSLSLADRTIEAVRAAIHSGILVPGELYSAYWLAEELGISRSPARDALLRLAETGLVKFERNRGFRVVLPTPQDIAEIFSIRLALEVPAARRASVKSDIRDRRNLRQQYVAMEIAAAANDEAMFTRHDQKFHALLLDIAGNNRTKSIVNNLRDATRLVGASTVGLDRSLPEVLVDHLPILEAFEAQDPDASAHAMEQHLQATGRLLLQRALLKEGSDLAHGDRIWEKIVR
jgi:DNA-binding GntR family transcriptional regulator